jgi:putative transposase
MAKKGFTPEQIINKLREAEVLLSQGATLSIVLKKIGISDVTYYRWRREYGGMRVEQARKLKHLEQENARIKKLVADLSLDNEILKEASRGTSKPVPETQDGHAHLQDNPCFGKTGVPGTRTGQDNPAPATVAAVRRRVDDR